MVLRISRVKALTLICFFDQAQTNYCIAVTGWWCGTLVQSNMMIQDKLHVSTRDVAPSANNRSGPASTQIELQSSNSDGPLDRCNPASMNFACHSSSG